MVDGSPGAGVRCVGLSSSGAFVFVDVGARTIEKRPASLDRSLGTDRLIARDGWVAIDARGSLWSVSPAFDEMPMPIARTRTMVARPDGANDLD